MPTIAITGGIASGKTSFRKYLSSRLDIESFDADAYVSELLDRSDEVRREIEAVFGVRVYRGGKADRSLIRFLIFTDSGCRSKLESILHSRVRTAWMAEAASCEAAGRKFLVDIPLLYETGAEAFCDFIAVVACPFSTQLSRLTSSRDIEEPLAHKMLGTQLPMEEKIRRADEVVWNNGPIQLLMEQAYMTADYLIERYG